jgi:glycerol-3-phosphate dehydrogenase
MNRDLAALANQYFDVVIIGGGILGAGAARDAALRGLSVALIDKADFAAGASSGSSKLIHGGFRYLEQRAFGLVSEACRERAVLQRLAPHLVKPLPFLFPVYRGDRHGWRAIRFGMTLYDWLARDRNVVRHRALRATRTLMKEPSLNRQNLVGSVLFHDCQEDDARFCLENIVDAAEHGATCANYCAATGFITRENRLVAVRVHDQLAGQGFEITGRIFINAGGPWVERIAALTPFATGPIALSPTKGVHLVVPALTQEHAIAWQARRDGRMLFVLPWGECSIVGTTDTDFAGNPDAARTEPADVAYLLDATRALMPERNLTGADIITTFVGVRALLAADGAAPSARSREHRIVRQGENLLSVAGGKYTTYRLIARQTVDQAEQLMGRAITPCRTDTMPFPLHRPGPDGEKIAECPEVYASDIRHACAHEMAMTLSDVMRRRTSLALSRHGGPDTAETVAGIMGDCLGWSEIELRRQFQQYFEEWKAARP